MSSDSETVEDTEGCIQAEVTDDSCTVSEIVPLDRPSADHHTSEFINDKPEDLQEMEQEPADENDNGDSHDYVQQDLPNDECETETMQVSSAICMHTFVSNFQSIK